MNRLAASCEARTRSRPSLARLACSTSLRSATEAPPGWLFSQSQCLGSKVTSRATTPNFGRPRPRGPSFVVEAESVSLTSWRAVSASRRSTSSDVPRKSTSTRLPVRSSKTRTGAGPFRSRAHLALTATSASSPDAMHRKPSKAVHRFSVCGPTSKSSCATADGIFTRVIMLSSILPGYNRALSRNRPSPEETEDAKGSWMGHAFG